MINPDPTYNPDVIETLIHFYAEAVKAEDVQEQDRITKQLWEEWRIEIYTIPGEDDIMWYQR